ncbi:MAG: hypothetical protein IJB96_02705 [Lachnospira sp.]|nr:hypothetical protein [Lachnospira sp.]
MMMMVILLQESLGAYVHFIRYADELVGAIGFLLLVISVPLSIKQNGSNMWNKLEIKILFILLIISVLGVVSNITSGIERKYSGIILDFFNLVRFFGAYAFTRVLLSRRNKTQVKNALNTISRLTVLIMIVLYLAGFIIGLGVLDWSDLRFGIPSFKFIFENSGSCSNFLVFFLVILVAGKNRFKNDIYIGLVLFLLCCTLRFKSFAVVAFFLCLYLGNNFKHSKVIKPMLASIAAVFVGWEQFLNYYVENTKTPRSVLLQYGIKTANRYFPLGSGFGTYGSSVAANDYSPLYYEYGFANTWTLGVNGGLLNDNFWPMICAQYGWFGFVLYIVMFIYIYMLVKKSTDGNEAGRLAAYVLIANIVLASTGGPIMMGKYATLFFMLIPIIV